MWVVIKRALQKCGRRRIVALAVTITALTLIYLLGYWRGHTVAARVCLFEGQEYCNRIIRVANTRHRHPYFSERPISEMRLQLVRECIRLYEDPRRMHKPLLSFPGPGWDPPTYLPLSRELALRTLEATENELVTQQTALQQAGNWSHPDDFTYVASRERLNAITSGVATITLGMSEDEVNDTVGAADEVWHVFGLGTNVVGYAGVYVAEKVKQDGFVVSQKQVRINYDLERCVTKIEREGM